MSVCVQPSVNGYMEDAFAGACFAPSYGDFKKINDTLSSLPTVGAALTKLGEHVCYISNERHGHTASQQECVHNMHAFICHRDDAYGRELMLTGLI